MRVTFSLNSSVGFSTVRHIPLDLAAGPMKASTCPAAVAANLRDSVIHIGSATFHGKKPDTIESARPANVSSNVTPPVGRG